MYEGKYTYREDITPEEQAQVVMENYDSSFAGLIAAGDVLICGENFGTGSSREQAATALKHGIVAAVRLRLIQTAGISIILARSVNETYKRNALNNGLLVLEVPKLVEDLQNEYGSENPTVVLDATANITFADAEIILKVGGRVRVRVNAFSP